MKPITEYVVVIDNEYHSVHAMLVNARKVYRSLINIHEVENKEVNVQLIRKTIKQKVLSEHNIGDEPVYNAESFADTINL